MLSTHAELPFIVVKQPIAKWIPYFAMVVFIPGMPLSFEKTTLVIEAIGVSDTAPLSVSQGISVRHFLVRMITTVGSGCVFSREHVVQH
jgi:hypothetical protein